jgi:hypothetical protein
LAYSQYSEFHFIGILHINGLKVPVQIDNDRNGHGRFRSGNGDNKQAKENTIQLFRVQVCIKGDKVDIHAVKDQLHRYQHRDHIPPRKQAIHANKKERSAYDQNMA